MKQLVAIGVLCAACGDNVHPPRILMDVGDAAPAYGRVPFPSDALRQGPTIGHIDGFEAFVALPSQAENIAAHLSQVDGFGLRPTVEFFLEGPIDPTTVPDTTRALTDAAFVLEVDPETVESGAPIAFDWRYDADRNVIVGAPALGVQLREGTRYAAVLTTDIKNEDGMSVFSSYELGLLGQDPPERWRTSGEAYEELLAFPELERRIAGLAVFTTQYASDGLRKGRNVIANAAAVAPPVLAFDDSQFIFDTQGELDALFGTATRDTAGPRSGEEQWGSDNPTGIAHDSVAVVATGRTTIVQFVGGDTETDGPEDETFAFGADGVPAVRATVSVPISVVLPRGTMPASGWPVVIYAHGLGGSRHDMLDLAEPITSQGFALVAIDMWGHGSRYSDADVSNNYAKPGFTGNPSLTDGFADDSSLSSYTEFFEGFQNFSAIRDAVRQSVLDQSRVAMLIRSNPSLAALGGGHQFDPARVAYIGEDLGALVGVDLAAIEPSIGMYVLDTAAGGLFDTIIPNSAKLGDDAILSLESRNRTTGTLDRFHPLIGIVQTIFDAADPLTFARHVLRDRLVVENSLVGRRHVVCLEVLNDEVMPNVATEALARAFGLHVLRPNVDPPMGLQQVESPASANVATQTAVLVQYGPATHGRNWRARSGTMNYVPGYPHEGDQPYPMFATPITIAEPLYETHAQLAEILATYFASVNTPMSPRVRSTAAPVADFDGDGRPDSSDPDPYDPTK